MGLRGFPALPYYWCCRGLSWEDIFVLKALHLAAEEPLQDGHVVPWLSNFLLICGKDGLHKVGRNWLGLVNSFLSVNITMLGVETCLGQSLTAST